MSGIFTGLAGILPTAGGGGGTTFITGQTPGTPKNTFNGGVGMKITVGGAGITITHLGRWVISLNALTHSLYVTGNTGTTLASVTVDCLGATAGTYVYGALGTPLALSASTSYYIFSTELNGGDNWDDETTTVTSTAAASVVNAGYMVGGSGGSPGDTGGSGNSYGPVNFKYT